MDHVLGGHTLIAGLDLQEVIGASDEQLVLVPANNIAGGRQRSTGIFGQDIFHLSKWIFIVGVRWDDWRNFKGSTVRVPLPPGRQRARAFLIVVKQLSARVFR